MSFTMGQAAKAVGLSKPTLSRAIKKGALSAAKLDNGSYRIDPAELYRWRDANGYGNDKWEQSETPVQPPVTIPEEGALRARLEVMEQRFSDAERTIDDLRERLDNEGEERRRLTAVLVDQRKGAGGSPVKKGFWAKIWG